MPPDDPKPIWGVPARQPNIAERIGGVILKTTESLGRDSILLARSVLWFRAIPAKFHEILRQMYLCGVMSFPVVVLVSIFAGAVLALQAGLELRFYGIEHTIGRIVSNSMCREMGAIMTALILAGRVGSAMAAELGTMRVSEEIDALEAMSIDPVRFLVMPRLVAMLIMTPILTVFSDIIGIIGGAVVAFHQVGVSYEIYFEESYDSLQLIDVNSGLVKAVAFGLIIATVGCGRGLRARTSAEGVGNATKDSVVVSFIMIVLSNYLITSLLQTLY